MWIVNSLQWDTYRHWEWAFRNVDSYLTLLLYLRAWLVNLHFVFLNFVFLIICLCGFWQKWPSTMDWNFYRTTPHHGWSELRRTRWLLACCAGSEILWIFAAHIQRCPVSGGQTLVARNPLRGSPVGSLAFPHVACFPSSAQCFLSQASFWVQRPGWEVTGGNLKHWRWCLW